MAELAAGELRPEIPDKLYFRIGEVSRLAGIKPYVLRFWETEFSSLGPKKSGKGHRLYRRKDVELVLEIKRLLYDKRYTIEGARKDLDTRSREAGAKAGESSSAKPPRPQASAVPRFRFRRWMRSARNSPKFCNFSASPPGLAFFAAHIVFYLADKQCWKRIPCDGLQRKDA